MRKRVIYVDFQSLENKAGVNGKHLNKFEREVYNGIGANSELIDRIDLEEKLSKQLTYQEKRAVRLYVKYGRQKDVAEVLGCSQRKISSLLTSAKKRIARD